MANQNETYLAIMAAFLVVSLVMGIIGWLYFSYARYPRKWPKTTGVIKDTYTASKHVHSLEKAGSLQGTQNRTYRGEYHYGKVLYEYEVDGKTYETDTIRRTNMGFGREEDAKKQLEKYTIGDSITVYYNPDSHNEAVLETDIHWLIYTPFLFVAIFLTGAIGMGALIWG